MMIFFSLVYLVMSKIWITYFSCVLPIGAILQLLLDDVLLDGRAVVRLGRFPLEVHAGVVVVSHFDLSWLFGHI